MIIAGIGCKTQCDAEVIIDLIQRAARLTQCQPELLALPAFKADEAGPRAAAAQLGLHLMLVEREALMAAQPRCVTHSARALSAVGLASIAEAAALAAAGASGRLILPRISENGATCALADNSPQTGRTI